MPGTGAPATLQPDRHRRSADRQLPGGDQAAPEAAQRRFQALDAIDQQLAAYQNDMRRDFRYQSDRVDNVLHEMAERGDHFFDQNLRITPVVELVNSERLRGEFERRVLADTSRAIERHVNQLIDWLIDRDYRQWQAVMEFIERRSLQHTDQMIGRVRGEFDFNRQNLLKSIGAARRRSSTPTTARRRPSSWPRRCSGRSSRRPRSRPARSTGRHPGRHPQHDLLDVTGILGASALAALGLYVLPYRRQKVKAQLRARIGDLRRRLDTAITSSSNRS